MSLLFGSERERVEKMKSLNVSEIQMARVVRNLK